MTKPCVLECRNISKTYSRRHLFKTVCNRALHNVNLTLEQGESLGLVGRNGSGKSTLIRILLGLETPDSGEVLLNGQTLDWRRRHAPYAWRRQIQVVFQDSRQAVNPRFTLEQILSEPLLAHGETNIHAQCLALLDAVGLDEPVLAKRPSQCSGGQLQRICIARALALKPGIMLLDESVCDLDLLAQAQILDLLVRLRQERGLSFLFVSHDLKTVHRVCQRVLNLEEIGGTRP